MRNVLFLQLTASLTHLSIAQKANIDSSRYPKLSTFTSQEDHDNMMRQLGIKKLRPDFSGNESAPNHANYDESLANPRPQLPDVLTTKVGEKVTNADMWRKQRRPELIEDFESEVYGRLPKNIPKVTWNVKVSNDFMKEKMPPMLTDMLNGQLAWRQHDGGHTDAPNYKFSIPWASKFLNYERLALQ